MAIILEHSEDAGILRAGNYNPVLIALRVTESMAKNVDPRAISEAAVIRVTVEAMSIDEYRSKGK